VDVDEKLKTVGRTGRTEHKILVLFVDAVGGIMNAHRSRRQKIIPVDNATVRIERETPASVAHVVEKQRRAIGRILLLPPAANDVTRVGTYGARPISYTNLAKIFLELKSFLSLNILS